MTLRTKGCELMNEMSQNKIDDLMGGSGFSLPKELYTDLLRQAYEREKSFLLQGLSPEKAWIQTIKAFHQEGFWGYPERALQQKKINSQKLTPEKEMFQFVRTFFVPTFVTKIALFYFGIHYSKYPGEGYGYGLFLSALATLSNLTYFAYIKEKRKVKNSASEVRPPESLEQ